MPTISVAKRAAPVQGDGSNRAQFSSRWLWPTIAMVSATGELDAANAAEFTDYGLEHVRADGKLVLDLSAVTFFGAACFASLHTVNVRCVGANVEWALIPSKAVSRVLRICDPDATLPTSSDATAALSSLRAEPRPLQLVAKPR